MWKNRNLNEGLIKLHQDFLVVNIKWHLKFLMDYAERIVF